MSFYSDRNTKRLSGSNPESENGGKGTMKKLGQKDLEKAAAKLGIKGSGLPVPVLRDEIEKKVREKMAKGEEDVVCNDCGNLAPEAFDYCPWCLSSFAADDEEPEEKEKGDDLDKTLDDIDKDLSDLEGKGKGKTKTAAKKAAPKQESEEKVTSKKTAKKAAPKKTTKKAPAKKATAKKEPAKKAPAKKASKTAKKAAKSGKPAEPKGKAPAKKKAAQTGGDWTKREKIVPIMEAVEGALVEKYGEKEVDGRPTKAFVSYWVDNQRVCSLFASGRVGFMALPKEARLLKKFDKHVDYYDEDQRKAMHIGTIGIMTKRNTPADVTGEIVAAYLSKL